MSPSAALSGKKRVMPSESVLSRFIKQQLGLDLDEPMWLFAAVV